MENKRLRAFAIFIIIGFVFIVNFAFFGVQGRITQDWTDKFTKEINYLEYKIDSLEKVVNSNLTHRRDTLIIDVRPQTIKIYQPNGNSSSMVERNTDKVKIGVRFLSSVLI